MEPTRGDEIIQRIEERRGHMWPLHRLMAELDPGFLDVFDQAYCHTLGFDPTGVVLRMREVPTEFPGERPEESRHG